MTSNPAEHPDSEAAGNGALLLPSSGLGLPGWPSLHFM